MIRVLFLYRYGILGGVCTQIHHRLLKLNDSQIEVHCGFMSNQGAEELLEGLCFLHFSLDVEKMQRLVNEVEFDVIVVGGGLSGTQAALRVAELGGKVCLIEKDKVGKRGFLKRNILLTKCCHGNESIKWLEQLEKQEKTQECLLRWNLPGTRAT